MKATFPSNASGTSAFLDSVSCDSAGDCTAVGSYDSHGLLLTKTGGIWGSGVEAALPANGASAEAVVLDYLKAGKVTPKGFNDARKASKERIDALGARLRREATGAKV